MRPLAPQRPRRAGLRPGQPDRIAALNRLHVCRPNLFLGNSKSARRSRSVKAIVTSFRVLRLRLGNDVRQPSRRKDWFTAPATRRFDLPLIYAAGVSCRAQEDGAGKAMTRQSETAGFGPRPRWRRFHQGALALAVAAPLAGSALLVAAALAPASAQTRMVEIGENKVGGVRVTQGKSQTLQTTLGFVDLVVSDPEIADAIPLTDRSLSVLGKKIGTARVSVYDAGQEARRRVRHRGRLRHLAARQRARAALPGMRARVSSANGRIMLAGTAHDAVIGRPGGHHRQAVRRRRHQLRQGARAAAGDARSALRRGVALAGRSSASTGRPSARTSATATKGGAATSARARNGLISGRDRPSAPFSAASARNGVQADVLVQALEERGIVRRLAEPNLDRASRARPRASSRAANSRSRSPATSARHGRVQEITASASPSRRPCSATA